MEQNLIVLVVKHTIIGLIVKRLVTKQMSEIFQFSKASGICTIEPIGFLESFSLLLHQPAEIQCSVVAYIEVMYVDKHIDIQNIHIEYYCEYRKSFIARYIRTFVCLIKHSMKQSIKFEITTTLQLYIIYLED